MTANLERLARQRRQVVEVGCEAVRTTHSYRAKQSRLEGRRASDVVAAQTDAGAPDSAGVQVRARRQPVEHGAEWFFKSWLDGQLELHLALARAVEGERGDTAAQEQRRERVEFLFGRVQPGDQHHHGRPAHTGRHPEVAGQLLRRVWHAYWLGGGGPERRGAGGKPRPCR